MPTNALAGKHTYPVNGIGATPPQNEAIERIAAMKLMIEIRLV
jgi:hypothetical protein